ncbi:MAG: tetratricopeptide repeat protein, partial [Sandaracinaceae bacterium]|nr:tetratricopeptide repeat protein [Sandaracinaceae bacterium]
MQWMRLAADQAPEGEEQTRLWTRLAALAASEGGDIRMAAESYRGLLSSDPTNRELWEPLVGVYVKLRDRAALDEIVASTLEALLDSADRNALRMLQANYLLDVEGAREDAIAVLKTVIDEDPDHAEAAGRLARLFEASGETQELIDLLHRQLDRARDRQDVAAIGALSLKMGKLAEPHDRGQAMDLYRAGLDWAPNDRELLIATLALFGPEDDLRERATLMERLLESAQGQEGVRLANQLIDLYKELDDEYGVARALDLGFKADPADTTLRARLEDYHRMRQDWGELTQMMLLDAQNRADASEAIARFKEAADILRDQLMSPARAAEAMRGAWQRRPEDLSLLEALVVDLVAAGLHG